MGRTNLRENIARGFFLLDGAMGTQLIAAGRTIGRCNEYLNIDSPEMILDIHRAYLAAGCSGVLTNTFGANRYALARHNLEQMAQEINSEGAKIARRAAGEKNYVIGNIGPSGQFLKPLGGLEPEQLKEAFTDQAKALLTGGVDAFLIETMTSFDEITIAAKAVKSVCGLPVFASMAFEETNGGFKTMMGVGAGIFIDAMISLKIDAVGFNCGNISLDSYIKLAGKFTEHIRLSGHQTIILAEPNAGLPQLVDGKAVYNISPDEFAAAAEKLHSAGVTIIGGCCGTCPEHIRAVAQRLNK